VAALRLLPGRPYTASRPGLPRVYTLRLLEEQLGVALAVKEDRPPARVEELAAAPDGNMESPAAASGRRQGWSKGRKWIVTISLRLLFLC
jgi:hypothetical protein